MADIAQEGQLLTYMPVEHCASQFQQTIWGGWKDLF
jgi:hypothetical protein